MRFSQQKCLACSIVVTCLIMAGCSDSSKEIPPVHVLDQPPVQEHSCTANEINGTHVYNEIDTAIACITSQLVQTDFDAKPICEKISQLEDEGDQRRYFKRLLDAAYSVHFEDYGDVDAKDFDERQRVLNRLGYAYLGLESLSMAVWTHFWTRKASQRDQFYPLFMYVEKMKVESERRHVQNDLYSGGLSVIERIYNVNVKLGSNAPDDFAWVRENFERLAGRPIRTAEQYEADSRRRMGENIKEHQKQQETNRRTLEFQKKYNIEHNIKVE